MKIVVVLKDFPCPAQPEPGIFVLRQIQALQRFDHEFLVVRVVPHAPPLGQKWRGYRSIPPRYTYEDVDVLTMRAVFPPGMIGLEYVRYQVSRRLSCIIQSFNPQLLHAHCLIPAGSYVIGKQLPTLVTAHGSDAYDWPWQRPGLRRLAESVANSATIIVAVSNFIRRHVERLGRSTVEVVFNGADDTVFSPAHREAARAKLGIKLNRPVVAFAGSLARSKGVFDLVAATEKLHDLVPLLVIIGEGPQSAGLKRFLDQARIEYRLCGVLTQSEIATAFGAADIVALPSYREGLPVVVCEAMLAGRAVLSTPVGGIPEIIADYETGRLVPAGDVEALSSALRELYLNPELKQKLEQQARNFAAAHLTWRANAARYDRLYSDTLSRFSNSGRRLVS